MKCLLRETKTHGCEVTGTATPREEMSTSVWASTLGKIIISIDWTCAKSITKKGIGTKKSKHDVYITTF